MMNKEKQIKKFSTLLEATDIVFKKSLECSPEPVDAFIDRLGKMWELTDLMGQIEELSKQMEPQAFGGMMPQSGQMPAMGGGQAQLHDVHRWRDGKLYEKTEQGWIPYDHEGKPVNDEEWGGHHNPQFDHNDIKESGAGRDMVKETKQPPEFPEGMKGVSERIGYIDKAIRSHEHLASPEERQAIGDHRRGMIRKIVDYIKNLILAILGHKVQVTSDGKMAVVGHLNAVDIRNLHNVIPQINEHLDGHIKDIHAQNTKLIQGQHKAGSPAPPEGIQSKAGKSEPHANKDKIDLAYEKLPPEAQDTVNGIQHHISNIANGDISQSNFPEILIDNLNKAKAGFEALSRSGFGGQFDRLAKQMLVFSKGIQESAMNGDVEGVKKAHDGAKILSNILSRVIDMGKYRAEGKGWSQDRFYHAKEAADKSFGAITDYVKEKYPEKADEVAAVNLFTPGMDGGAWHVDHPHLGKVVSSRAAHAGGLLEKAYKEFGENRNNKEKVIGDVMDAFKHVYGIERAYNATKQIHSARAAETMQAAIMGVAHDIATGGKSDAEIHDLLGHISNVVNGWRDFVGDDKHAQDVAEGKEAPPDSPEIDAYHDMLRGHLAEREGRQSGGKAESRQEAPAPLDEGFVVPPSDKEVESAASQFKLPGEGAEAFPIQPEPIKDSYEGMGRETAPAVEPGSEVQEQPLAPQAEPERDKRKLSYQDVLPGLPNF